MLVLCSCPRCLVPCCPRLCHDCVKRHAHPDTSFRTFLHFDTPPQPCLAHPAGTKAKCEQELAKLQKLIAKKEEELAGISQQAADASATQQQLQAELAAKQRRLTALYEKQGRSAQVGGVEGVIIREGPGGKGPWGY